MRTTLPASTPLLDRATIARFVLDDFPLSEDELAAMTPAARHALEDALRSCVDFENAAAAAVELWRGKTQP